MWLVRSHDVLTVGLVPYSLAGRGPGSFGFGALLTFLSDASTIRCFWSQDDQIIYKTPCFLGQHAVRLKLSALQGLHTWETSVVSQDVKP